MTNPAQGAARSYTTLRDVTQDITLNEKGEIEEFRTKLRVSFKYKKS